MKTPTLIAAAAILCAFASANAGQIWTDGNGDGLPDGEPIVAAPSTNITVGVWIDAQSFSWTNFLAYIEWSSDCVSYVSASYVILGGSNFPIDNFSHPRGIGFSGSGYAQGGVDQIGNVTLHVNALSCCVTPIIDIYNPYYVFSQLGAGSSYMLFTSNPGTCLPGEVQQGACCFVDGSCQELPPDVCEAQGGAYLGDGTDCATEMCLPPQNEACCLCGGECVEAPVGQCPPGSVPQGPGTSCAVNICDDPGAGACCLPDGSCIETLGCFCVEAGGIFQGTGSSCSPEICPPPPVVGACCLPTLECVEATLDECNAEGGTWFGPGSSCLPSPCETAVEPRSWGHIKGLYR